MQLGPCCCGWPAVVGNSPVVVSAATTPAHKLHSTPSATHPNPVSDPTHHTTPHPHLHAEALHNTTHTHTHTHLHAHHHRCRGTIKLAWPLQPLLLQWLPLLLWLLLLLCARCCCRPVSLLALVVLLPVGLLLLLLPLLLCGVAAVTGLGLGRPLAEPAGHTTVSHTSAGEAKETVVVDCVVVDCLLTARTHACASRTAEL